MSNTHNLPLCLATAVREKDIQFNCQRVVFDFNDVKSKIKQTSVLWLFSVYFLFVWFSSQGKKKLKSGVIKAKLRVDFGAVYTALKASY